MTPKQIRKSLGKTQAQLAHILGASASQVARWERGEAVPKEYEEKLDRLREHIERQEGRR